MQSNPVTLIEVSPRDGLQNEKKFLPTADKIQFIQQLSATGSKHIEVTSFVSAKLIPQLQDHSEVLAALTAHSPSIEYSALIPNLQGFQEASGTGIQAISLFTAASESFNQHNIHCSIAESIERFRPIIPLAQQQRLRIRAYVSCALGCPYEGHISPQQVTAVCKTLLALGVDEISLADTIGIGTPKQTEALLQQIQPLLGAVQLAMHFHDTYGQALANILTALNHNVVRFDTSVAGLGGCPYAPGASGNVATEDVLYMLQGLGIETGIDLDKMIQAGDWICKKLNRNNQSKVSRARLASLAS